MRQDYIHRAGAILGLRLGQQPIDSPFDITIDGSESFTCPVICHGTAVR
jgi:hypothetical protein